MKLLIIFILSTLYLNANLTHGTNTVHDSKNKLRWQDTKDNVYLRLSHEDAIKYCQDLTLAGVSDWYLPSRDEYKTIIDKTRKDENQINKIFKFNLRDHYWIGETTWRSFGKYAYYVFFTSGNIYYENKTYKKFVRCVR